jgi:Zn ribbon nucleic-acid-binding protein
MSVAAATHARLGGMIRSAPVLAARCPHCGCHTLQTVEFTRAGQPAVLECVECGAAEIVDGVGPHDVAWPDGAA